MADCVKTVGQALCGVSFIIHFLKYYGKYKNCVSIRQACFMQCFLWI
ncbi:hypothetical protein RUMCAL_01204 [Ruminococcus callidus ATCC 27760]|uniref:Uncharacterized protein n=1 Tax=Ruminococcus callidus ATCC 27760 TaxID=411473 RepID=U2MAV5_9FIRM|nr:hypothetical protein RUMCAL_01204 [Ruminococcus callidus ATCC 27760]